MIPFRSFFDSVFTVKGTWYKKYFVFLLCFLFLLLHFTIRIIQHQVRPKNASILTLIGLYLFMATGIFLLMQALDRFKKIRGLVGRTVVALITGIAFVIWLFILLLWLLRVFGF